MPTVAEFRRSSSDSVIAGVCGGVARNWGIDPTFVRVAAAVLAISAGIGLFGYAAVWLLVPRDDKQQSVLKQNWAWARGRSDGTLWIIAAIVILFLVTTVGTAFPFGLGPVIVLALVWYFGFRGNRCSTQHHSPPAPSITKAPESEAFDQAAAAWAQRVADQQSTARDHTVASPWTTATSGPIRQPHQMRVGRDDGPATPPPESGTVTPAAAMSTSSITTPAYSAAPAPQPASQPATTVVPTNAGNTPVSPRRKALVWLIAVATSVAAIATLSLLNTVVAVPAAAYPAALLGAVGLTLVAGAFFARPRGLLVIAIMLGLITVTSALVLPQNLASLETGTVHRSYSQVAEIPETITLDAGEVTINLADLTVNDSAVLDIEIKAGSVTVILPESGAVDVHWEFSGVGAVDYPDGFDDGLKATGEHQHNPGQDTDGTVRVNIHIGVGEVVVI